MQSLPILYLLLLTLHAPRAQGQPLWTEEHSKGIKEMRSILNESPVASRDILDPNETFILRNEIFLRINLDEFLKAAKNLQDRGERIRKILEELKVVLPTPSTTDDPINIKDGNWADFKSKFTEYLDPLEKLIEKKIEENNNKKS